MCQREAHETRVWWQVDAELHRAYWCECECHEAGTAIDLTSDEASADVDVVDGVSVGACE